MKSYTVKEIYDKFGDGEYLLQFADNKYGRKSRLKLIIKSETYRCASLDYDYNPNEMHSIFFAGTTEFNIISIIDPIKKLKEFLKVSGYLLFLFLITSCGQKTPIDSIVQKFETAFHQSISIDINLIPKMDNGIVGICWIYSSGYRKIELSQEFWDLTTDLGKEELLLHELGHCILNRQHDTKLIQYNGQNIPESIMYPYVFGAAHYYSERENDYIQELFQNAPKMLWNNPKDIVIIN